jgi:peptidoglycan hydrolase-like protein with peptidoglycan-binding domain
MSKIIRLTESDLTRIVKRVINEQLANAKVTNKPSSEIPNFMTMPNGVELVQRALLKKGYNVGMKGADGILGPKTKNAIIKYQRDNGIKQTGIVGPITAKSLGVQSLTSRKPLNPKPTTPVPNKTTTTPVPNKNKTTTTSNRCIAISKEECDKISSTKESEISTGTDLRCSAYMVKCLREYDDKFASNNAWNVFDNVQDKGQVKYNAFTDGSVNWNNIYSQLKKSKNSKKDCDEHMKIEDADKKLTTIPKIVTNSIPQSSKINISSLELGDVVGLYHKDSANKGVAFCETAIDKNLDDNGNMEKTPFTFNSHVGFVGAIKDGVPIVIHNVHGHHIATPATQMLNKNDEDMIVWVVSDNEVKSAVKNNKVRPKKSSSSFLNFLG